MSYNNHDQNARVWFEFSTNSNLSGAKRVAETTVAPREGGSQWHADLNGLLPGTTYYYRAFIRNYDGEVYSAIASFRTAPEPRSVRPRLPSKKHVIPALRSNSDSDATARGWKDRAWRAGARHRA